MRMLFAFLIAAGLVVSLSGCTVTMEMDYLHPTGVPVALPSPQLSPTASPAETPRASVTVTPTVPPAPPVSHFIILHPEDGPAIASTVEATTTLALDTYPIEGESWHTEVSFSGIGALFAAEPDRISLMLARPVTSTTQVSPMTPSLTADWIALQRTSDVNVQEPSCDLVQGLNWRELRLVPMASDTGAATPLPVEWSWPIRTLCVVPAGVSMTEMVGLTELWCKDDSCTGQQLWVDMALVDAASNGPAGWTLHRFVQVDEPGVPGGDEEKKAACKAIGCLGGASVCLYCWVRGCGC